MLLCCDQRSDKNLEVRGSVKLHFPISVKLAVVIKKDVVAVAYTAAIIVNWLIWKVGVGSTDLLQN